MRKSVVVLGVIGADVHAVGNKILEHAFTEAGLEVVNLGVMVSQTEFVNAAVRNTAVAIVVSSLYGHGEIDCRGLRTKCIEAGIAKILLYVGGNLVVGKAAFAGVEKRFREMGFDRVYSQGATLETAITDLRHDLEPDGDGSDG
jgi:methylaspartate mutase sigma subunit